MPALADIGSSYLLQRKWLLTPSLRVGHQWTESLARSGQPAVNIHPVTVNQLARELVAGELVRDTVSPVSADVGPWLVRAAWDVLPANGYFGRLEPTAALTARVHESLNAVRMADLSPEALAQMVWEPVEKGCELVGLLRRFNELLHVHALVDDAEICRRAVRRLREDQDALGDALVLVPESLDVCGLQRRLLETLPQASRVTIEIAPTQRAAAGSLSQRESTADAAPAIRNDARANVAFFRAIGETNEIREVLRRCLHSGIPLDHVELLHTDPETYVPLIANLVHRYAWDAVPSESADAIPASASGDAEHTEAGRPPEEPGTSLPEPRRLQPVPVTFADGLPTSLSRPGRALALWLQWLDEDCPQQLLVRMIENGLLECANESRIGFGALAHALRPIGIGFGAGDYLWKLDEQIESVRRLLSETAPDVVVDSVEHDRSGASIDWLERRLNVLQVLREIISRLLGLTHDERSAPAEPDLLEAAVRFLETFARKADAIDQAAAQALGDAIRERRAWMETLNLTDSHRVWLADLPARTRALRSGPRPGHLHVATLDSGGHSGRPQTYVVGLDDRRFPGATLQDPILLDEECRRLSADLPTSAVELERRLRDINAKLIDLPGQVTLSWPCRDVVEDREVFLSSLLLARFRQSTGQLDADFRTLADSIGPPASFAPASAEHALDETELWLAQFPEDETESNDPNKNESVAESLRLDIEARYPHLASGRAAGRQRHRGFGAFNGHVPEAGRQLDPTRPDAPPISASRLETAGACPLRFFFRHGLQVAPPEEPDIDPDRWLDARSFGVLVHEVFREFLQQLRDDSSLDSPQPDFERDHERLASILQAAVERWRTRIPPPNEPSFRIQYWQLVQTCRIFLQEESEFCRSSRPQYFEVAIGFPQADPTPLDHLEPIPLMLPNGRTIRVRGQVDRIDQRVRTGQFAVWDYKTGSGADYKQSVPFQQGRKVQSTLYMQMMQVLLQEQLDPSALVERFGYFFVNVRKLGHRMEWTAAELDGGPRTVQRLCALIAAGAFLATNDTSDCAFCDYRSICGDVRAVTRHSKHLLDHEDLPVLQPFRELRHD